MSAEFASLISDRCQQAVAERVFPGCVVGVIRGDATEMIAYGGITYGGASVTSETIYDCASITKAIPTSSLVLMLIAEGRFELGDLVRTYILELRNDHSATIEDLLRHRVAGIQMSTLVKGSSREIQDAVLMHGFDSTPHADAKYTNVPTYLLGVILERITGKSLDTLAREIFFEPLTMQDTHFFPPDTEIYRIAPTEVIGDTEVVGVVHDESARVFAHDGRAVGHAGLFSTAGDLLRFAKALLDGEYAAVTHGAQRGLGWELNQKFYMGNHFGPRTFGKRGFTGTNIVVDVDRGIALAILSNRTYPHRPDNPHAINAFRRDIADIVLK